MSSFSSTTRITGLNSGLDIDSLVEKMMSAESAKYKNLQRKSQKVTWQQESYRNIISKLQTFQNKWFGSATNGTNLRYGTTFNKYTTSVKNADNTESTAITIDSSSISGDFEVKVEQLAKADMYVSNSSSSAKTIKSSKSLDEVAATITADNALEFSVNLDGVSKSISVSEAELGAATGTTEGEKLQNALNSKLEAAFGSASGKQKVEITDNFEFQINVDGGAGHIITINEGKTRDAKSVISSNEFKIDDLKGNKFSLTFAVNGGDKKTVEVDVTDSDTNSTFLEKLNKAISDNGGSGLSASFESKTEKDSSGNDVTTYKLKLTNTSLKNDISVQSSSDTGIVATEFGHIGSLSDLGISEGETTSISASGSTAEEILSGLSWDSNGDYKFTINDKEVTINKTDTLSTVMDKISNDTGVKMSYNSVTKAFKLEATETGLANAIDFSETNAKALMAQFGITESSHKQEAQDAVVTIDGVTTTRSSNEVDIDGLKMTLNSETTEAIKVGASYDSDAVVENIKGFVEEYNSLIEELNSTVKTTRSKSGSYDYYEPLLDEEKKEMSDDQIEKWETEAKKGLLYNDGTIKSILSNMRSALYDKVTTEGGKTISLYSIGITTSSDYTQGGKLVIDEDKLKAAVKEDGDLVKELFTQTENGLGDKMNSILNNAVGSKGSLRAKAGIVGTSSVSENTLSKQLKSINEQIQREKDRLADKEQRYYELFANMESAISKSNSQLDSIYSMLA